MNRVPELEESGPAPLARSSEGSASPPLQSYLARLAEAGEAVIAGDYKHALSVVREIREDNTIPGCVQDSAALVQLIATKVEAGEAALAHATYEAQIRNQNLEMANQLRQEFTRLFSGSVILLCFYAMALSFLKTVAHLSMGPHEMATQLLNLSLYTVLATMIFLFVRRHRYQWGTFGLTTRNWRKAVTEALICCAAGITALVLLKALLVRYDPQWSGRPVMEWTNWGPWQMVLIYVPVAFAQEAMGRGFTQTCIERLLTGRRRKRLAIVLASAEFGAMHLHYSFGMGMIAFAGSIFLGVLYARHRTLVGVTLCHYVLGQLIFGPLQLMR